MAKRCRGGSGGKESVVIKSKSGKVLAKFRAKRCKTPPRLKKYAAAAKVCATQGKRPGTKSMGACIVAKARRS